MDTRTLLRAPRTRVLVDAIGWTLAAIVVGLSPAPAIAGPSDPPRVAHIPQHELRGVLDGRSFTPTSVELRRDGNQEWWILANLENGKVEVQIPVVFPPVPGACIEQPVQRALRPAFSDLRSGKNNYANDMSFVLSLDAVNLGTPPAKPHDTSRDGIARGGLLVRFGPKGERGWFGGRFDKLPIVMIGGAPTPRACTSNEERQKTMDAFKGKMGKRALEAKSWRLVHIPIDTKPAHWTLFADLADGGTIRVDLDREPARNTCIASDSQRVTSGPVPEVAPPRYVVAFDTVMDDKATGWVIYDWLEGSKASGRFEATRSQITTSTNVARRCVQ